MKSQRQVLKNGQPHHFGTNAGPKTRHQLPSLSSFDLVSKSRGHVSAIAFGNVRAQLDAEEQQSLPMSIFTLIQCIVVSEGRGVHGTRKKLVNKILIFFS
uniref:Uncharacterized protein n=1 Tax=Cacopsylla melanoneura TaxID=428564 RepID=A0A8D8PW11_9HEMI